MNGEHLLLNEPAQIISLFGWKQSFPTMDILKRPLWFMNNILISILKPDISLAYKLNSILLLTLFTVLFTASALFAQGNISIIDVSPTATDVSEQAPPAPARISLFAFQGTAGSQYTIRFSIPDEPSLIVGVGAQILTTSFDQSSDVLTVVLNYSGEKILADENIFLPDSSFLIALDPGIDGSLLPLSDINDPRRVGTRATGKNQSCYGPGAAPELYQDSSGDFGDDDGLNDPVDPSNDILTIGLPKEAAGSFASTNAFYWCIVPPKGDTQGVGMRLLAAQNSDARLSMTISKELINFMGTRLSRTINFSNLAIFSDELQVSVDVNDSSDGASIAITLPIDSSSTQISPGTSTLKKRAKQNRAKSARATTTSSPGLDKRTISIGVKEALTLSPDSLKVIGKKVVFSGFVDDLSLVGELVEIIRIGSDEKCGINISTVKGTVIARGKIASDGSYNVQIPASAVFNQNSKKSTLVARITGDSVRTSREVSLSNKNRNLRQ